MNDKFLDLIKVFSYGILVLVAMLLFSIALMLVISFGLFIADFLGLGSTAIFLVIMTLILALLPVIAYMAEKSFDRKYK